MSTFVPKNTLIWAFQPPTSERDYALSNFPCRTCRNQNLIPLPECVSVNIRDINSCGRQWPFINLAEYLKRVFGQEREEERGKGRSTCSSIWSIVLVLPLHSENYKLESWNQGQFIISLEQTRELMFYRRVRFETGDDVFMPNGTLQQSRIPSEVLESWNITCICLHCIYEVVYPMLTMDLTWWLTRF